MVNLIYFIYGESSYMVEVGGRLLEKIHWSSIIFGLFREMLHVPVHTLQVVLTAEELELLETPLARKVALDGRVHLQEPVQRGRARFLGTQHQDLGQAAALFGLRPDLQVPLVLAGVAPHRGALLRVHPEVDLGQLARRSRPELQVGPAAHHVDGGLESVRGQAILAVVGHVRHENADWIVDHRLKTRRNVFRFRLSYQVSKCV